jgi:hypothetical protein
VRASSCQAQSHRRGWYWPAVAIIRKALAAICWGKGKGHSQTGSWFIIHAPVVTSPAAYRLWVWATLPHFVLAACWLWVPKSSCWLKPHPPRCTVSRSEGGHPLEVVPGARISDRRWAQMGQAGCLFMMGQPISCRLTQAGRGAFEACGCGGVVNKSFTHPPSLFFKTIASYYLIRYSGNGSAPRACTRLGIGAQTTLRPAV